MRSADTPFQETRAVRSVMRFAAKTGVCLALTTKIFLTSRELHNTGVGRRSASRVLITVRNVMRITHNAKSNIIVILFFEKVFFLCRLRFFESGEAIRALAIGSDRDNAVQSTSF